MNSQPIDGPRTGHTGWATCFLRLRVAWRLLALKMTAIVILLALDPDFHAIAWVTNFTSQGRYFVAAVLIVLNILCCSALLVTGLLANPWLRLPLVVMIAVLASFDLLYFRIAGEPLDHMALGVLFREIADFSNAAGMYYRDTLVSFILVTPVAVLLAYLPRRFPIRLPTWVGFLPVVATLPVIALFYNTGGLPSFPSPFRLASYLGLVTLATPYTGPRDAPRYAGTVDPPVRRVVLIVDESVRGDYLGINTASEATTPYLSKGEAPLINFGIASSIANCSAETRLALRTGLRKSQIPDSNYSGLKQPSIWQFAKRAGLKTIYIDGFRPGGSYHSYMNKNEAAAIDQQYHFADVAPQDIDLKIAELIRTLISDEHAVFIYADKRGVHFPYHSNYPKGEAVYSVNYREAYGGANREALINDYRNALLWSVDRFFQRLLSGLDLADTLILYTSDHGQNLLDDGARATHCRRTNPAAVEASVPLLAFTAHPQLARTLREAAAKLRDRTSQFHIFPTMLAAMGYDKEWISREKDAVIWDAKPGDRSFYVGGIFGKPKPGRWVPFPDQGG